MTGFFEHERIPILAGGIGSSGFLPNIPSSSLATRFRSTGLPVVLL
jgi:hypothetical protein